MIDLKKWKIGQYLRELSAIIIGVAVTLFASYKITNISAEKDTALYLDAIKLELEENRSNIEKTLNNEIQIANNYATYLRSHQRNRLNLDSLLFYKQKTVFNAYTVALKTNAFDMFKTSGNMRLVQDKKFLLSLWEAYDKLESLKQIFEMNQKMKLDEMKKYFYLNSLPDKELLKNPPMYDFYVNMYVPYMQRSICNFTLVVLNETIDMID